MARTPATSRYHFLLWLTGTYLLLNLLCRLLLTVVSWHNGAFGIGDLLYSFVVGSLFDLASLSYLLLPCALWLALIPLRWRNNRLWNGAALLAKMAISFGLILQIASEWVFWNEFETRFNFIAVDYLVYTHEVLGNIQQSYPVTLWLSICALLALGWTLTSSRFLKLELPSHRHWRWSPLVVSLLLCSTVSLAVEDGEREQRSNRYANELAGNGLFSLFAAYRNNQLDYQRFYSSMPIEEAGRLVKQQLASPEATFLNDDPLDMRRNIVHQGTEKRLNVVLITVESLSGSYIGALGSQEGLTPELDKLASQGLFFTQLYATGNRTVRGLEALSLAVPPTPGQSIVRRPDNSDLFTLGSVFRSKGYQTHFLYGGYGTFDNMNNYFAGNGYAVKDRTDLQRDQISAETIWGVADEDLFHMALREFDKEAANGKPFFAHLMTTSNHRPYHFPDGRINLPQGKRNSAVRYTDWAIGDFLRQAETHAWGKDTVFVIVADHCASSAGKTSLPPSGYHIPMIIWSPAHIAPARIDKLMSQIDMAPTLLGLLNFSYESQFLGQDIFATASGPERAFIATYQSMGYMTPDNLAILEPQRQPQIQRLSEKPSAANSPDPAKLAIAWYEFTSYAYSHGLLKEPALKSKG